MIRHLLIAFAVAAALISCGEGDGRGPIRIPPTSAAPTPVAEPATVDIPAIKAQSTLIPLGFDAKGALEVPSVHTPLQAGWFSKGVHPGAIGRGVIVAHIDGDHVKGLFYHLKDLSPGDPVHVGLVDGTTRSFKVTSVESFSKDKFPTARVYGDVDHPALALITCGGAYDPAHHNYLSNIIAFADLAD